jgi:hypothetical protein
VTGPLEPEKARTRSGLAKLRGESAAPGGVIQTSSDEPEPAPTADVVSKEPQRVGGGVVTLEKPELEASTAAAERPNGRPVRRGPVVTVVALVVAVAALLAVVLVNPFDGASKSTATAGAGTGSGGTTDQRLAVVRAAGQFTVSFFTYDYRKIDIYFKRIEGASSGAFRKDFVSKEKTLQTVVTELKTVATGQIPDAGAGLVSLNGDNATALIAANFNASNAVTKNGQKRYRVKIALQRVKGVWLVTDFDQVV